jgi:hypothetical protein
MVSEKALRTGVEEDVPFQVVPDGPGADAGLFVEIP